MNNPEIFIFKYYVEFNNKTFAVLSSKQTRLYLLEYDKNNNSFRYPKFEDYLEYFNTHTKTKTIMASGTLSEYNNNQINKNKLFRLIPKVLFKGQFVGVAAALLMTGCAIAPEATSATIVEITPVAETTPLASETVVEQKDEALELLKSQSIDAEYEYYDDKAIFINQYHDPATSDTIYCRDLDEAKEYMGIGTKTYDDVLSIIDTKNGLSDEQKELLKIGVDNMKRELPNLDVTVLYYNVDRISFREVDQATIDSLMGVEGKAACYDRAYGIVYYNPNNRYYTDFDFAHEVLGHGSMEALFMNYSEGKFISYGYYQAIVEGDLDKGFTTTHVGLGNSEAAADIIAEIATGRTQDSSYEFAVTTFKALNEICDIPLDEFLNARGRNFYKILHEKANIDNPVEMSLEMDQVLDDYYNYKIYGKSEYLNDYYTKIYVDYSEEKVMQNGLSEMDSIRNYITNDNEATLKYSLSTGYDVVSEYNKDTVLSNVEQELTEYYNKTR